MASSLSEPFLSVYQSQAASYIVTSALAVFVYDIFATLPDEVEYIWSTYTSGRLLPMFPTARVFSTAIPVFTQFQDSLEKYIRLLLKSVGLNVLSPLVNIILALWLYALYQGSKKVLMFLSFVIIGELLLQLLVTYDRAKRVTEGLFLASPNIPILGCLSVVDKPALTLALWVPLFIIACTFFGMMLYRLVNARKSRLQGFNITASPLHMEFLRGGAAFFLIVTVVFPLADDGCIDVLRDSPDDGVLGMRTWTSFKKPVVKTVTFV
ncbi:hypothetical protein CVT24_011779 [Panaeolus cyanescens]|uniref:DUF6533 domain-containing protein n=1 Tax=Panaeolus cyanescens TaxID=181874 RepID=A0A409VHR1_9AGAR|nr:hypothetical protein CVT24_011779 [Panaeolus cyanescens]